MLAPGEAGVGFTWTFAPTSPYRGYDRDSDLMPQFRYDSRYFYLQSDRIGLKLESPQARYELFLRRRLEGFASDHVPESMVGMEKRSLGSDLGVALRYRLGAGVLYGEAMQNVSDESEGTEIRLGYRYERWWSGRLRWRPYVTLAWRDADLNNYYYGVRPEEATAERAAYQPGSGMNLELGVLAAYRLAERWQILAGAGVTRWSSGVADSPVVDDGTQPHFMLGLMYGFTPEHASELERRPLIMKLGYGQSSDCDLMPILTLQCTTVNTQDETSIVVLDVGQVLVRRLNGWPLDIAGFIGFVKHLERGLQPDSWQVNGYFKPYYSPGPWFDDRLRIRLGFGAGISYASRVPFSEQRDMDRRGRDTSKLLLYLDPTIDLGVGNLFGVRELRETFVGLGVSHRSGIFGSARLFNSVDGGSNYIYTYVETHF
ncbi:MAG TPA: MipA/OmpV family protein [Burkholderiales bacterium]|nr:MipA/OmpV family protein [Burkholderiales bacterium]